MGNVRELRPQGPSTTAGPSKADRSQVELGSSHGRPLQRTPVWAQAATGHSPAFGHSAVRNPAVANPAVANPAVDNPAVDKTAGDVAAGGSPIQLALASRAIHSGGSPMDPQTRRTMQGRLGGDFSGIRLHTDARAGESAQALGANAYALGNSIVFAPGRYDPASESGQRLLAHELAHTMTDDPEHPQVHRDVDPAELDKCVAELGGSPAYRDGGVASPEELEGYRAECRKRLAPPAQQTAPTAAENLGRAWEYAKEGLDAEVVKELEALFTPQAIGAMAMFAALYVGSQLTPVGWVADAFALTVLTVTVIAVGALAVEVFRDVLTFLGAVNATSEAELREAGAALRRAIARGGVALVVALLTRGAGRGVRPGPPPSAAPAIVTMVTTEGLIVRMPVGATVSEAVQASKLQSLASFAVMVPPPGGHTPSAPGTSGSGSSGSGPAQGGAKEPSGPGGGEPGKAPAPPVAGFSLGVVRYGEGALSVLAQRLRIALGLRRGGNVAVFEFANLPDGFVRLLTRLGGRNFRVDGNRVAFQNVSGSAHSEQLAHELIVAGRRSGHTLDVKRIYSEYSPCTDKCLPLIQRQYPNAEVTYSFRWDWGRQAPDRNAAVDALFSGQ